MRETSPALRCFPFAGLPVPGWCAVVRMQIGEKAKRPLPSSLGLRRLQDAPGWVYLDVMHPASMHPCPPTAHFLSWKDRSNVNSSLTASFSFFSGQSTLRSSWDFFMLKEPSPEETAKWSKSSCLLWLTWSAGRSPRLTRSPSGSASSLPPRSRPPSPGQPSWPTLETEVQMEVRGPISPSLWEVCSESFLSGFRWEEGRDHPCNDPPQSLSLHCWYRYFNFCSGVLMVGIA